MPAELKIRPMWAADIPFADHLRALAGWNQVADDWHGYLEFEPEGCFVAELDGRRAGTATAVRYEHDKVGWIGMVLVDPEQRRFGVGTALLRATVDYLRERGVRSIKLDATPMGKKVYLPLGFVDEYEVTRYEGITPSTVTAPGASVAPLATVDPAELSRFDVPIFGVERHAVLASLSRRNPGLCFAVRDSAGLAGYLIAREGHDAVQLGPWLAREPSGAETLLRALFAKVPGRRVFLDVPDPNAAATNLVTQQGFGVQRGFTRMYLGANDRPGIPRCVFGTSGAEKG